MSIPIILYSPVPLNLDGPGLQPPASVTDLLPQINAETVFGSNSNLPAFNSNGRELALENRAQWNHSGKGITLLANTLFSLAAASYVGIAAVDRATDANAPAGEILGSLPIVGVISALGLTSVTNGYALSRVISREESTEFNLNDFSTWTAVLSPGIIAGALATGLLEISLSHPGKNQTEPHNKPENWPPVQDDERPTGTVGTGSVGGGRGR